MSTSNKQQRISSSNTAASLRASKPKAGILRLVVLLSFCITLSLGQETTATATNSSESFEACQQETAALNTNSEISQATTALLTTTKDAILEDFRSFCRLISRTCTADLAEYSADLKAVCEANEGQFAERNYQLACRTDTISPVEIPGRVLLNNIPVCLGPSCDPDNLPPSISEIRDDAIENINTEVNAALGDNVVCEVGEGSAGRMMYSIGFLFWGATATTLAIIAHAF